MRTLYLFIVLSVLFLSSCSDKEKPAFTSVDFGTSEYYEPFLWVKSDTAILEKELKYEFNNYASRNNSYVIIKLVDKDNNLISDDNIQLYCDGELINSKEFRLDSRDKKDGTIKVGIRFLPEYEYGYSTGFLSESNHNLDRINNNDLNSENRLFKWEAEHKLKPNPLLLTLIWSGILILVLLALWFLIFRNRIYPKFKKGQIQITEPYYSGVRLNKCIKEVIFTNTPQKQSALNKFFTGKIHYEINPVYEKNIYLRPKNKNSIQIKLPLGARISPMSFRLEKYNKYEIKLNNKKIKIQYS